MRYGREIASTQLFDELMPLFEQHYLEISHFQDVPLDPNFEAYLAMEASGALRIYVAREEDGEILGYSAYIILRSPHYRTMVQAMQDVLFIRKEHRGFGRDFLSWCEEQLKADGVSALATHVHVKHDFGKMLERLGYEKFEHNYIKRLGA